MLTDDLIMSIRRIIGVDETVIPDDLINDPMIGPAVVQHVQDLAGLPPFEDRPETEQARMRQAVAYMIASRLLGTREMRQEGSIESERFSDQYQTSYNGTDVDAWAADLMRIAREALDPLLKRKAGMTMFGLARGRRGA